MSADSVPDGFYFLLYVFLIFKESLPLEVLVYFPERIPWECVGSRSAEPDAWDGVSVVVLIKGVFQENRQKEVGVGRRRGEIPTYGWFQTKSHQKLSQADAAGNSWGFKVMPQSCNWG